MSALRQCEGPELLCTGPQGCGAVFWSVTSLTLWMAVSNTTNCSRCWPMLKIKAFSSKRQDLEVVRIVDMRAALCELGPGVTAVYPCPHPACSW